MKSKTMKAESPTLVEPQQWNTRQVLWQCYRWCQTYGGFQNCGTPIFGNTHIYTWNFLEKGKLLLCRSSGSLESSQSEPTFLSQHGRPHSQTVWPKTSHASQPTPLVVFVHIAGGGHIEMLETGYDKPYLKWTSCCYTHKGNLKKTWRGLNRIEEVFVWWFAKAWQNCP